MKVQIETSWNEKLTAEFEKLYFIELVSFVRREYQNHTVYPRGGQIFNAFSQTPFSAVKVVILGQDPYHGAGQAHGLSFSVPAGISLPPSLQNIYRELHDDLGGASPKSGDLTPWARQGVLLLNATLTVQAQQAGSHQNRGWELFTDAVIHSLAAEQDHIAFILWGAYAQKKGAFIDKQRHLVLTSAHPSPFAAHRGFFGSKPFSQTNAYLVQQGKEPIDWLALK